MNERAVELARSAALGRWDTVIRRPDPALRSFVDAYKGYASRELPGRSRHVPRGGVGLIIGFESGFRVIGPDTLADYSESRTSFVAGMHETYSDSQWLGRSSGVQVDFTPTGAYLFFGVPMDTLTNRVLDFEDLLGADARRLVERLGEAVGWEKRFRILESFVASRLVAAREPSREVSWAWSEIQRLGGGANIGALADNLGWSKKRLITRFREQVGVPPKTAARVARFSRAVNALDGVRDPDWASVALEGGYYDQSHMIREFREFAGLTPSGFVAMMRAGGEVPRADHR
jgi:AraC-like DNA-binding protein